MERNGAKDFEEKKDFKIINTEAKQCFKTHDEDIDYSNMRIYIFLRSKLICQNEKPLKRRTYKCITTVINKESQKLF